MMILDLRRFLAASLLLFAVPNVAAADALWRITLETRWLGPAETYVDIRHDDDGIRGVSRSGSVPILRELAGDHDVEQGLVVFEATPTAEGHYTGTFLAPWREGDLRLEFDGDTLSGSVEGGAFSGTVTGQRVDRAAAIRDFDVMLEAFDDVVASRLFSPGDLEKPAYLQFRQTFGRIAETATDDLDMLIGFHLAWKNDPFSHFELRRSSQKAAEMLDYFDNYRVGFDAATVEFQDDLAVLRVATMMGADTIEQVRDAYARIAEQDPATLVVDLRGNSGGAFAVKPLVEHIIDKPLDAGFFISQQWNRKHDSAPTPNQALQAPIWHGWSIKAFWESVQNTEIVRLQFTPAEPNFDGRVFVLLDERSASATELAADALRASGLVTIVGRKSPGEMLSQSMFDVADGYMVSLPVADYYSISHGRIEGVGVPVDVETAPEEALDAARELARN